MKCENCMQDGKGMKKVVLGCGHRQLWCAACFEPSIASRRECDGCRMARYRAGQFRWFEDKDECRAELAQYDAQHAQVAAS